MNRYIVINGHYDDISYYVINAADMSSAMDVLKEHFDSLSEDDRPTIIDISAIGVFDESATIVRIS